MIETQTALADLMGVSKVAVHKWLKHADWCFGPPPWPRRFLHEIREWRADPAEYVWRSRTPEQRRAARAAIAAEYRKVGLMTDDQVRRFVEGRP